MGCAPTSLCSQPVRGWSGWKAIRNLRSSATRENPQNRFPWRRPYIRCFRQVCHARNKCVNHLASGKQRIFLHRGARCPGDVPSSWNDFPLARRMPAQPDNRRLWLATYGFGGLPPPTHDTVGMSPADGRQDHCSAAGRDARLIDASRSITTGYISASDGSLVVGRSFSRRRRAARSYT
jgi:hypothetical protein